MIDPTLIPRWLLVSAWVGGLLLVPLIAKSPLMFIALALGVSLSIIVLAIRLNGVKAKAQERWKAQVALWEKAVAKWNTLYYCARDDCVFDPGTNKYAPVERMHELLYQVRSTQPTSDD